VLLVGALTGCSAVFGLEPPISADSGMPVGDGAFLPDGSCAMGYKLDGDMCVDVDECATATDDCSTEATCANTTGSFTCTCGPGFAGDGRTCTRVCTTALLYDDCPAPSSNCSNIMQSTYVANAATGLGLAVQNGGDSDEPAFRTLFDAGNFDLLIIDASRTGLDPATASRIATWVNGNGRAIITFWDLDNSTTGMTIRSALGGDPSGNYTSPQNVYLDPNAQVNLFDRLEQLQSPLTFTNVMVDDGDTVAPQTGQIVARHLSSTGSSAIAITHTGHAITLGFLSLEATRDADADGKPDVTELYTNMIGYLCGY